MSRLLGRSNKATPPERCRNSVALGLAGGGPAQFGGPQFRPRRSGRRVGRGGTRPTWRIAKAKIRKRASSVSGWSTTTRRQTTSLRRSPQPSIFRCRTRRGPEDQAIRDRLHRWGDAFDRDYIRSQITAHQETVQLFEYGSRIRGKDLQLKFRHSDASSPDGASRDGTIHQRSPVPSASMCGLDLHISLLMS